MSALKKPFSLLALLIVVLSFSCGESGGNDDDSADGDADYEFGEENLEDSDGESAETEDDAENSNPYGISWSPCSLEEGKDDGMAQCAAAMLPLVYEPESEKHIEIGAKCWKPEGESAGRLWLLQGGPGASGMMTFAPFRQKSAGSTPNSKSAP